MLFSLFILLRVGLLLRGSKNKKIVKNKNFLFMKVNSNNKKCEIWLIIILVCCLNIVCIIWLLLSCLIGIKLYVVNIRFM